MSKEKKPTPKHPQADPHFLKSLQEEDQMHDDHGPAIIGRREKKPKKNTEK